MKMKNKFELKEARDFGWEGLKGKAYNNSSDFKNASAAFFEVTGRHGKVKSLVSDRIYYIMEGEGEFIINEKAVPVKAGDVIIVPKNTPYDYRNKGKVLKLFLVHTPAFEPDGEVNLES
jgi:mannose-6-phosphate isomerase-like protein (cupin superfamily)